MALGRVWISIGFPLATPQGGKPARLLLVGKMAKALVFIKGAADPTAMALKLACETGKPADIKKARALFIKLKPSERKGAMAMISDD